MHQHGVEPEEAGEAYLDPDGISATAYAVGGERRSMWIGKTDRGRALVMVTGIRERPVRIITARDAVDAEKRPCRRRGG